MFNMFGSACSEEQPPRSLPANRGMAVAVCAGTAAGDADAAGPVPPQRLPHHGAGRHLEPALDAQPAVPGCATAVATTMIGSLDVAV